MLYKQEDLLWLLLRYRNKDNQVILGWKGLFYEITKETADIHIAGYLPTICQSPTKMNIVLEMLKQCNQKAEALSLNEMDLVLDHAIHTKAVEIVMNEKFTDASMVSCLRQLLLCSPLLLLLGIIASSSTGPSQHIPAFQRRWTLNQTYYRKVQQSSSRSGHQAIYKESRGNLEESI